MRGTLTTTAIGVALVLFVVARIALFPLKDCWCCSGQGVHRSDLNRKHQRRCWWCKGTGKRWRIGRRIWNRMRQKHHDAR
ncbi:hypothetical protein [Micromonospora sp. WMMD980]|uniref:hypothetical protein n=1 Tax=Micromonospora sp. WMMD980 TaxID=3016088 RepID=UPI002415CF57|nr:hypothetical protein [Micromonospora sp. WMMD980]MDG4798988.1 hypothetical protein [Micromonospora sp. WMMD980]MDG4799008.1 hypothetical protein [Micromonospora sp. WMMD980]MDG4799074.1 hypothetical protein [Micromonospora sp. WMMD980]